MRGGGQGHTLKKCLLQIGLEIDLLIVGRDAIEPAQVVESGRDSNVVIKHDALMTRFLAYLVEQVLVEFVTEIVAAFTQCRRKFVNVDGAATVRVHHQEVFVFVVKLRKQVVKLFERDFTVAIFVIFINEDIDRFNVEFGRRLAAFQCCLKFNGRNRAVSIDVHFVKDLFEKCPRVPTKR